MPINFTELSYQLRLLTCMRIKDTLGYRKADSTYGVNQACSLPSAPTPLQALGLSTCRLCT